jgi:hypothetical protein
MKLLITPEFKLDYSEYYKYYISINTQVARTYKQEVKESLEKIKHNKYFEIRYSEIRCLPLFKFPFMVHYKIEDDVIYILALIHTSRDPLKHWIY